MNCQEKSCYLLSIVISMSAAYDTARVIFYVLFIDMSELNENVFKYKKQAENKGIHRPIKVSFFFIFFFFFFFFRSQERAIDSETRNFIRRTN